MRNLHQVLFGLMALAPFAANAAGTYYTGNYQSPQSRYTQKGYSSTSVRPGYTQQQSGYYYPRNTMSQVGYSQNTVGQNTRTMQRPSQQQQPASQSSSQQNQGFFLGAGLSRETAMWKFEMKESSSILHYDNIDWNVLDVKGGYMFNVGNTPMQINAGFRYGMQSGDSSMVDDDITNGGYFQTQWVDSETNKVVGEQIGHALSLGTSSGGNMYGFNIGIGLTDFFKWGNVKFTPSVGYRYLKYKLETENNYGLAVDTAACFRIDGSDEIQCDPAIVVKYGDGKQQIIWRDETTGKMEVGAGATEIETGGTYYYEQPGVSHSYEVEWSGPYLALDMDYVINQNNSVNGHIELGFPGYTSTGDQPYRIDWQHPKSVEDKAGMFSAIHFGMGANWMTAITDTISLSVGVTYDYYHVSDADASTYLNQSYYNTIYNTLLAEWEKVYPVETEKHMLGQIEGVPGDPTALNIKEIEASCPGWVCKTGGEIESFYKSLGVRVGLNAKF